MLVLFLIWVCRGVGLRLCEGAGAKPLHPHGWPAVPRAAAATRKLTSIRGYLLRPTNAAKAAFVRGAACGKAPPTPPPFSSCAGGFAPSTPLPLETQRTDKPKFTILSICQYSFPPHYTTNRPDLQECLIKKSAPIPMRSLSVGEKHQKLSL